ncbi:MAG: ABC transporter ATP-binding protein [Gemmatales bacterium]
MSDVSSVKPVELRQVTKRYKQGAHTIEALRAINLTVEPGQFVAVMGPSGSGKSTLLHVMAGLTMPDSGDVIVEGENLGALSDYRLTLFRRRRIGLVFQSFNLIPSLTAEQNAILPLLTDSRRHNDSALDNLMQRLGIAERRSHRPDALSGGEQQRVAIARALITEPALVLADEPTGSLDSVTGQALCKLLSELCREQKRTIVLVTHEPTVAAWAERVLVMKDGLLMADFSTEGLRDSHALATRYQQVIEQSALHGAA